ncbi:MAG: UDP-N-acetylglucosamine--N-acetylmuramyl-(pentapeptide) pyrophosphoryl-undecaprenol N-acetylglucosamine transferase [Nanoarchaeota archaeon]|nr:UDP-N-acetylglucosamine--N-acetylmuramyl-(pentapeptide) pyrophosphoryl-undecaprenol N-acetylglucosamine transferase [Nanoarchaeota archaeon]
MRKVLFVPSGIGLGHAVRTHNIINHVRKKAEFRLATYGDSTPFFNKLGYEQIKLRGFNYHGEYSFELMQTLVKEADIFFKLAGDYLKLSRYAQEFPYDTIVSDSDPIGIITANFLRKRNVLIENLQIVLDEAKYLPKRFQETLSYQIGLVQELEKYITQYLDLILVTSFNNNKYADKKKHNIGLVMNSKTDDNSYKNALKNEFIAVPINGSALSYNIVHELISVFKNFPKQNFYFINFPTKIIKKIKNIYLLPFMHPPELRAYMKASKAVVSFAGHSTLTEIAHFKKPSLILPLPNHIEQISNATFFRRNKLAEVVFPRQKYENESVTRALTKLFANLNAYEENIKSMNFNFNGAENAEKLILTD